MCIEINNFVYKEYFYNNYFSLKEDSNKSTSSKMNFFQEGYSLGQKVLDVTQKLDDISDILKVLDQKNVFIRNYVEKLDSLKGKLFDLNVELIYLVEKQHNVSDLQLKMILEDGKNELLSINYKSILLKIQCCKLLNIF